MKRYVMVRESRGWRTKRDVFTNNCKINIPQILCILIDLFFPDGASSRGQSAEMNYLANFLLVNLKITFHLEIILSTNYQSYIFTYCLSRKETLMHDQNNHSGTDDLKPYHSASDSKQKDRLVQGLVKKM